MAFSVASIFFGLIHYNPRYITILTIYNLTQRSLPEIKIHSTAIYINACAPCVNKRPLRWLIENDGWSLTWPWLPYAYCKWEKDQLPQEWAGRHERPHRQWAMQRAPRKPWHFGNDDSRKMDQNHGKNKEKNRSGQLITHDIAILSFLNFGNFFDVMHVSTFIFWRYQENPFGPWQSKTKEKIWKNYSWMVQVQGRIPCKSYISIYIYI